MTNALTVYDNGGFELMQRSADAMVKSGYFKDSRDIAQAVVKVMAGAELGIAPFAAMTGIHIVNGRPTLSSNLIATLVKNDERYNYRVKVATDTECILTWFEGGQACGESSFTMKEATSAGLTGKAVWKQYPSDMLFARALTRGARRFAPGIFGGAPVYTPEEMGADENEAGDIIDVTPQPGRAVVSEVVDGVIEDFDDLQSASDSRKETSPPAQAERKPDWDRVSPPMTDKKRKEFHAIGTETYGPDWNDKRHQLCAALGVESSNDLTMAQAQKLIDGMRAKLEG